jgi:hypothetical protein
MFVTTFLDDPTDVAQFEQAGVAQLAERLIRN